MCWIPERVSIAHKKSAAKQFLLKNQIQWLKVEQNDDKSKIKQYTYRQANSQENGISFFLGDATFELKAWPKNKALRVLFVRLCSDKIWYLKMVIMLYAMKCLI